MKHILLLICLLSTGNLWSNPKTFIRSHYRLALETHRSTGIDPIWLLSHSGIESGWQIPRGYNYFGVKGKGFEAYAIEYFNKPKGEVLGRKGELYRCRITDNFRSYSSPEESWLHYSKVLRTKTSRNSVSGILKDFCESNYSTSPTYRGLLERVVKMVKREVTQYPVVLIYEDSQKRECPGIVAFTDTDLWISTTKIHQYSIYRTTSLKGSTYLILDGGNYRGFMRVEDGKIWVYIYQSHVRHEMVMKIDKKEWARLKQQNIQC